MGQSEAQKRARNNYVKRHPERIKYQHYKSTARLFVKMASQEDLVDLINFIHTHQK
ncbi:MAG: hypothetical protein ABF679_13180 [Lentilactobacillus diolivorans]|jgi:hypothetical protein|uniref:hypothetical protein n=1 Tax=Lentilactobacillus diolivorans TaxID=179838 RepID=UPI002356F8D9|nr:hypothetical protein [Lentilactobacillus diolivorans]